MVCIMYIEFALYGNNLPYLVEKLQKLDPTRRWKVEVKQWKAKRSHEQNARYWKLLTELGKHLGYTQEELHDICRFKFLRNAIEIEGERLPLLKTTTKLNTKDMAEYQDAIERWASTLGFIFDESL